MMQLASALAWLLSVGGSMLRCKQPASGSLCTPAAGTAEQGMPGYQYEPSDFSGWIWNRYCPHAASHTWPQKQRFGQLQHLC